VLVGKLYQFEKFSHESWSKSVRGLSGEVGMDSESVGSTPNTALQIVPNRATTWLLQDTPLGGSSLLVAPFMTGKVNFNEIYDNTKPQTHLSFTKLPLAELIPGLAVE